MLDVAERQWQRAAVQRYGPDPDRRSHVSPLSHVGRQLGSHEPMLVTGSHVLISFIACWATWLSR